MEAVYHNPLTMARVLEDHLIPKRLSVGDLVRLGIVVTLRGQPVRDWISQPIVVEEARILLPDLIIGNGIVHVIDRVLVSAALSEPRTGAGLGRPVA